MTFTKHTYQISIRLFGGKIGEENPVFKVKKENAPLRISSSNWPRKLIFGYVIQILILYRLEKKNIFCIFVPPAFFRRILDITELWPEVILTQKYWIRRQNKSTAQIWRIFLRIEWRKWFLVQLPSSIWRGDKEEQHYFEVKKRGNPHISPPNWLGWLIFGYVAQLLIFYRLVWKRSIFAFSTPQHPHPSNWSTTEFWPKEV